MKPVAALVGDSYHKAGLMSAALTTAADGLALEVFTDPAALPWDALNRYACLVIAREGRLDPAKPEVVWFTDRHQAAIADFVSGGGGFAAVHSGLANYGSQGRYAGMVRGVFLFHPPEHPRFQLRPTGERHPVTEGVRAAPGSPVMEIQDEMYFVRVDSGRTTRLLEAYHPDYGSSTAAWAHQEGRGRVFCLTPGHRQEVLESEGWRKLAGAGIRWACGEMGA